MGAHRFSDSEMSCLAEFLDGSEGQRGYKPREADVVETPDEDIHQIIENRAKEMSTKENAAPWNRCRFIRRLAL